MAVPLATVIFIPKQCVFTQMLKLMWDHSFVKNIFLMNPETISLFTGSCVILCIEATNQRVGSVNVITFS
jgi:hypothetical protein